MNVLKSAQAEAFSWKYCLCIISLPFKLTGRYAMMMGMEADIILVPEFDIKFHGEQSLTTHILRSLEKQK